MADINDHERARHWPTSTMAVMTDNVNDEDGQDNGRHQQQKRPLMMAYFNDENASLTSYCPFAVEVKKSENFC